MSGHSAPGESTRRLDLLMDAASDLPFRDVEQIEDLIRAGERGIQVR
jgi:hypothetical protein